MGTRSPRVCAFSPLRPRRLSASRRAASGTTAEAPEKARAKGSNAASRIGRGPPRAPYAAKSASGSAMRRSPVERGRKPVVILLDQTRCGSTAWPARHRPEGEPFAAGAGQRLRAYDDQQCCVIRPNQLASACSHASGTSMETSGLMVLGTACQKIFHGKAWMERHCDLVREAGLGTKTSQGGHDFLFGSGPRTRSSATKEIPVGSGGHRAPLQIRRALVGKRRHTEADAAGEQ